MRYPPARRTECNETLHGEVIPDPYRWMEEPDTPEIRQWIEAQNRLTFDYLTAIPEREAIRRRMAELWDFEKFSVPFRRGSRYFFSRNDGLQNQSVLYWQEGLDGEPRQLLDPNTLSADGTVALTGIAVSADGKWLAYSLSDAGSDWQEWRVRAVESGTDLADHIRWSKFSGASWSQDNQGFYYSRYDEPAAGDELKAQNYCQKLYYHHLGTPQAEDVLVYHRPDEKEWGVGGEVTDDGRYLILGIWRGTERENAIFYLDLQQGGGVVELLKDFDAAYEFIANQGSRFYFFTDRDAPLGRVIAIDLDRPNPVDWVEIIPEGRDSLQQVSLVGGRFFCHYLHDAHSRVAMFALDGKPLGEVALPGLGTVEGFSGRLEDQETFFQFSSFTTPGTVYRYELPTGSREVFRAPSVGFNPDEFEVNQVFYPSKDGTRIPMFLCHKKGIILDGNNPTYLFGYGGFNISKTPLFEVPVLVWLEMGGVYAQANLRGGGEYGKAWHDGGRLKNKQNVFDDFIAAGEWLIANGYTRRERLGIGGRSNGGLLVGACLTQRPDLFGAALPNVGVLDMLRFHKFTIGWAWVSDFGSPDDPADFAVLRRYSPYHNIRSGTAYPPTMILTGDHDDRVYPAHSFKFAAALQAAQAGDAPVLIRINTRAGHGVGKPTAMWIEEFSDMLAFLWQSFKKTSPEYGRENHRKGQEEHEG